MRQLKDLSIKKKLLLIITCINLFALILAFTGFIVYDVIMFRTEAKKELAIMAELIGYNCTASLVFNDPGDARQVLSSFKADDSVVTAWIFTVIGSPFAGYVRNDLEKPVAPLQLREDGFYFEDGGLSCFQPILLGGIPVGTIFIQSDLRGLYSILKRQLEIIAVILMLSLLCSFLLSTKLQHLITRPLMNLGDLARSVSKNKDYSIRGTKEGMDETGQLIDAFNEMLEQIEAQNESLMLARREMEVSAAKAHRLADETKQANVELENEIKVRQWVEGELKKYQGQLKQMVEARTAQLTLTNEQLSQEIAEREVAEEKIRASLAEKSTLLGEIHHRVRNNLQVISSLLDMTKNRTLNDEARTILSIARSRIHTMALIHSQLYESEDFNRINMGKHLQRLIVHIQDVYDSWNKKSVIKCPDVYLSVTQAIPCALVFNEAISNVYKHAYKADESGTCYISMKRSEDNRVFARVKDEGVGIPESVDVDKTETLGLKLLRNLIVHQLKGEFRIERNEGTDLLFEFDIVHDDALIHGRH